MGRHWKNYYLDSHVHHVTCTVHQWQMALLYPPILSSLYDELLYSVTRWDISIIGYVIMPEHFHTLFFCQRGQNVSKAIHGIRRSISGMARRIVEGAEPDFGSFCRLNKISPKLFYRGTSGKSEFRFWKEKPRVFSMTFEDEIRKKLDYIHNNPVRRGLVKSVDECEHSSARAYIYGEDARLPLGIQLKSGVK